MKTDCSKRRKPHNWSVTIRPPVLNADSAAIIDAITDDTSRAIQAKIGYFGACIFYQYKMSKLYIVIAQE